MFEKKDSEIKELQANVSVLETHVVKLEQQINETSAHERKNILITQAHYLLNNMQRIASILCEKKSENTCA